MQDVTLEVLNGGGHLSLKWNADDPADRDRARAEVKRLADAGYAFFLVGGQPADPVAAGAGELVVRRIDDPVEELITPEPKAKRGRPLGKRAVAVQRMAGG